MKGDMMNIYISAVDKNKIVHTLSIKIKSNIANIEFIYSQKKYEISLKEIAGLLKDYNNNYSYKGRLIEERNLYKALELNNKCSLDRDLARIFAISSLFMQLGEQEIFNDITIYNKFVKEQRDIFLNDINIFEWSGDLGAQPGIYFIKKEYVEKYNNAIEKFFNLGLLYKYNLEIEGQKYENYIFPFVETNVRNYEILNYINIWNQILNDRNFEILKFVNGQRGRK